MQRGDHSKDRAYMQFLSLCFIFIVSSSLWHELTRLSLASLDKLIDQKQAAWKGKAGSRPQLLPNHTHQPCDCESKTFCDASMVQ